MVYSRNSDNGKFSIPVLRVYQVPDIVREIKEDRKIITVRFMFRVSALP